MKTCDESASSPAQECNADSDTAVSRVSPGGSASSSPSSAPNAPAATSSLSFRKFRELLMAKHFENRDNEPVEVAPRIFLGSFGAANNLVALKAAGITHIVCVSPTLSLVFPEQFSYLRLAVADTPDASIAHEFDSCLEFIDSALASDPRNAVLVHCFVGRSRSVTVVVAYLLARQALSVEQALERVRLVRPQARPNTGFLAQLRRYEAQLTASRVPRTEDANALM
ncbi:hypothetical protein P43SY_004553 [Pythium insidiosum]|uniref:Dual specificity protein phosphatase n=1 Tax=Pythium insidiosum TaxID=114742 RepID=A0AAD5QDM3_PYTIN|nr:hypothetical protein P43SY_004553 [Pythium insidiosum]